MAVIPLTLTISLCLVATFVLFFLRESTRRRFSSAESDALLPLAEEGQRAAGPIVIDFRGREPRRRSGCSGSGRGECDNDRDHCSDCPNTAR